MHIREESLARLTSELDIDVLVVGAGVNGVAAMRDLALNGVSALVVDRADIAQGASSASSRMAHGGLRYLENREFALVAESTRERNLLLRNAPHFTRPLPVVVPLTRYVAGAGRSIARFLGSQADAGELSLAALTAALSLYEFFGRDEGGLPSYRSPEARAARPSGLARRYKTLVTYYDARITNPEGLIFEMIEDAMAAEPRSACLSYAQWLAAPDGTFEITDGAEGRRFRLRPKQVINAAGAWIDAVNRQFGLDTAYVRPVKGAHLLLRHEALFARMQGRAFYFDDGHGRMVIAYPLDRTILLGTTEIAARDPDDAFIARSEVDYLLGAMSRLFDDITVGPEHVVALTTGIRPLQSGGGSENQAKRDHAVRRDVLPGGQPLLSLVGGKWTTFRAFGEQVCDIVLERLDRPRRLSTRTRPLPGAAIDEALRGALAERHGTARAEALLRRYGARAAEVSAFCVAGADRPLETLSDYSAREVEWLVRHRMALHLDDLLLRRTQIVLDGRCDEAVMRECADLLAGIRHLGPDWAAGEVARCRGLATVAAHGPGGPFKAEACHA